MLKYFNGEEWAYVPTASSDDSDIWSAINKKMDKVIKDTVTNEGYSFQLIDGVPYMVKEE